ncbi:MAG: hypothetical protein PF541_03365 [Prolixibacteraceae bacterium]|jgi:hypothetical protein|nr:hypothetical protein [Prolixibacteraceae bacterium]
MEKIQILHNSKLDLVKWDEIIYNSTNSRVYAESWYLDIIDPDWKGLVYGDYNYIMPIIAKKKWAIEYYFQPTYAQQHGIYPPSTPQITNEIIVYLNQACSYYNLSMNSLNIVHNDRLKIEDRKNFILSLKPSFNELQKGYNSHAKRNTKKALRLCTVSTHVNSNEYLKLKQENSHSGFSSSNAKKIKLILTKALRTQRGLIYGAYSQHNELIAAAFFIVEQKRLTYLNSVSTSEGKESRAMYAIVTEFIKNNAESAYLLDFEGSNVDGIARFFKGFGALPETYQHIQYNNLPWFLKIIKK